MSAYAYSCLDQQRLQVLCNFGAGELAVELPRLATRQAERLIGNYPEPSRWPWKACACDQGR